MSDREYTVIVGDLKESRNVDNRQEFADCIPTVLKAVSDRHSKQIHAPLVLTRGIDEMSGVLVGPGMSYEICRAINAELAPAEFRFAIVAGEVDVGSDTHDARRMDGPAFHRAGALIERAREENRCYMYDLGLEDAMKERLINELVHVNYVFRCSWTDREREIADTYGKLGVQGKVAEKLGISQPAVSKALRSIKWEDYAHGQKVITEALQEAKNYN